MNDKPVQIESGEWWYKGCFIQKQNHPKLKPYIVFQDTEIQTTVGDCYTFTEAKKIATIFEVKKYKYGPESFV